MSEQTNHSPPGTSSDRIAPSATTEPPTLPKAPKLPIDHDLDTTSPASIPLPDVSDLDLETVPRPQVPRLTEVMGKEEAAKEADKHGEDVDAYEISGAMPGSFEGSDVSDEAVDELTSALSNIKISLVKKAKGVYESMPEIRQFKIEKTAIGSGTVQEDSEPRLKKKEPRRRG